MRFQRLFIILIFISLSVGLPAHAVLAQEGGEGALCPGLVEFALDQLESNCTGLGRNSACYGFNRVDVDFFEPQEEGFFSTPADQSALALLDQIRTTPLDTGLDQWGVAVMNVQANIPNTFPGQGVVFLLMGDVTVENEVETGAALELADPIAVTTVVGSNLRSAPRLTANVVGSVAGDVEFGADGLSADNEWLRVLFEGRTAWISRSLVTSAGELATLPTITEQSRTPMQAFSFRGGVGSPECNAQPPSALLVQGPQNVTVDITVNGADIRLGSTILLRELPGGGIQLIAIDGDVRFGPNTPLPPGFTIVGMFDDDGNIADWFNLRPLTQEELDELAALANLPASLLHYAITLPTLADIQAGLAFIAAIQASGSTSTTDGGAQTVSGNLDCSSLVPTSPLGGMAFGPNNFFWNGVEGATGYRVTVNSGDATFTGETAATNISLNVGGTGFDASWYVEALVDGQVACRSTTVTSARGAPPPPPEAEQPAAPTLTPQQQCEAAGGYWYMGTCYPYGV